MPKPELWISVDVEADGPIPGPFSMLSLGACVAGLHDGRTFTRIDPELHTFSAELQPISDRFEPDALAVSGLDRDRLIAEGAPPAAAMTRFADWIAATQRELGAGRPVCCAYPLGFDWLFTYHYLIAFTGASPFSHGRHVDIKTLYLAKAGTGAQGATKRSMAPDLLGARPHTHDALDDAQGQADLLANLMEWRPQLP